MDSTTLGFLVVARSVIEEHLDGDSFVTLPPDVIADLIEQREDASKVIFSEMLYLNPLLAAFPEMTASILAEEYWEMNADGILSEYSDYTGALFQIGAEKYLSIMAVS